MTESNSTPGAVSPVHVSAFVTGRPGTGDRLLELLVELAASTRAEAGCLLYSLQRAVENPDLFVTVEKWAGQDALDAHMNSPHLQAALSGAGELLAGPPMIIATIPVTVGDESKARY